MLGNILEIARWKILIGRLQELNTNGANVFESILRKNSVWTDVCWVWVRVRSPTHAFQEKWLFAYELQCRYPRQIWTALDSL